MIATRMGNGQYSLLACASESLGFLEATKGVRKTPALPQGMWDVGEKKQLPLQKVSREW